MSLEELLEILNQEYDKDLVNQILKGFKEDRYVTIRVNTLKTAVEEIKKIFDSLAIKYQEVSWYKDALIILNKKEDDIRSLAIYESGQIYLQSLSSMLPPLILNPQPGDIILDMTAAPGSKTTEMAALSNNKAMITAVEKNRIRSDRLKYNINKLGAKGIIVLNIDAQNLDDNFVFDKILLDAPCSGSGTLKIAQAKVITNFNKGLILKSIDMQEKLLKKACKLVKKGGIIVYSTCSILKEENEDIINKVVMANDLELVKLPDFEDLPYIKKDDYFLTVLPTKEYEGFFVAMLRKK